MLATPPSLSTSTCRVELRRDDHWCRLVIDLREPYQGGPWMIDADNLRLAIDPADELAASYTRANWESGLVSGARYAFRKLKTPLRKLGLYELAGRLSSDDMTALAYAAARGVGTLVSPAEVEEATPLPVELEGWTCSVEQQPVRPTVPHSPQVVDKQIDGLQVYGVNHPDPWSSRSGDVLAVHAFNGGAGALFLVADCLGHGERAAPYAQLVQLGFTLLAPGCQPDTPVTLLHRLHDAIRRTITPEGFIATALCFGITRGPAGRRLSVASAGSEPALLVRQGNVEELPVNSSPARQVPLGADHSFEHLTNELRELQSGDVLVACTDGVLDRACSRLPRFDLKGFLAAQPLGPQNCSARDIALAIESEVLALARVERPPEDWTILVVKVDPEAEAQEGADHKD